MSLLLDAIKKAEQRQGKAASHAADDTAEEIEFTLLETEFPDGDTQPDPIDLQTDPADLTIPFDPELLDGPLETMPESIENPALLTASITTDPQLELPAAESPLELTLEQPNLEPDPEIVYSPPTDSNPEPPGTPTDEPANQSKPISLEPQALASDTHIPPAVALDTATSDPLTQSSSDFQAGAPVPPPVKNKLSVVRLLALLTIGLIAVTFFYYFSSQYDEAPSPPSEVAKLNEHTQHPNIQGFGATAADPVTKPASTMAQATDFDVANRLAPASLVPEELAELVALAANAVADAKTEPVTKLADQNNPMDNLTNNHSPAASSSPTVNTADGFQPEIFVKRLQKQDFITLKTAAESALNGGDLEQATTLYQQWLKRQPHSLGAFFGLAASASLAGDRSLAISYYQNILQIDPANITAQASLLNLPGEASNQDLRQLLALLKASPNDSFLNYLMGSYQAQRGDWKKAQGYYFDAHSLQPGNASYSYNLAIALDQIGQRQSAINFYRQALTETIMPLSANAQQSALQRLDILQASNH